jgi:hypothetical protein
MAGQMYREWDLQGRRNWKYEAEREGRGGAEGVLFDGMDVI